MVFYGCMPRNGIVGTYNMFQNTQKNCTKKGCNELDYFNAVVSHPKSDILESKVKWALGSTAFNRASVHDRILVELFKTLKDDAIKVLHSVHHQIWKTQQWPQDWKRSIYIPIPKNGYTKECASQQIIALISHITKVMLKILHARLQHYVNQELPDVQARLRKGRGIRYQIANIHWIIEIAREFQKNRFLCFIDYVKAFDCVVVVYLLSHVQLFETP